MFFKRKPYTVGEAIAGLIEAQDNLEIVADVRAMAADAKRRTVIDLELQIDIDRAQATQATRVLRQLKAITDPQDTTEGEPAPKKTEE